MPICRFEPRHQTPPDGAIPALHRPIIREMRAPFFSKRRAPAVPRGGRRVERSAERTFRPLEKGRRKNMLKAFFPALPPDFKETGVELAKGRPPDLRGHLSICAAVRPAQKTPRRATLYHVAPRRAMPRRTRPGRCRGRVTPPGRAASAPGQATPRHASPPATEPGEGSRSADTTAALARRRRRGRRWGVERRKGRKGG